MVVIDCLAIQWRFFMATSELYNRRSINNRAKILMNKFNFIVMQNHRLHQSGNIQLYNAL